MRVEGLERRTVQKRGRASRDFVGSPSSPSADHPATILLAGGSRELQEHSRNVEVLAGAIATRLGLRRNQLQEVVVGARLHDVGKRGIPDSVIEKPGPLTSGEWELMRRHTIIGEALVSSLGGPVTVAKVVRHSHERWDGYGYPDGLRGNGIPLASRIVFCADSFDAICSGRAYQDERSAAEALAELRRSAGTQLDPQVVKALEEVVRPRLYGTPHGGRRRLGSSSMALLLIACFGVSGSALASLKDSSPAGDLQRSAAAIEGGDTAGLYPPLALGESDSPGAGASRPQDTRGDTDRTSRRESDGDDAAPAEPLVSGPVQPGSDYEGLQGGPARGHGGGHSHAQSHGGGKSQPGRGRGRGGSRGQGRGNNGAARGQSKK